MVIAVRVLENFRDQVFRNVTLECAARAHALENFESVLQGETNDAADVERGQRRHDHEKNARAIVHDPNDQQINRRNANESAQANEWTTNDCKQQPREQTSADDERIINVE